jgi:hypothetical protein
MSEEWDYDQTVDDVFDAETVDDAGSVLDWSDSEDEEISADQMKKLAVVKKTKGTLQKLREQMDKEKAKKLEDKVDSKPTKKDKKQQLERKVRNPGQQKQDGYWKTNPGEYEFREVEMSTAEEQLPQMWQLKHPKKIKEEKKETRPEKYVDFSRKTTKIDVEGFKDMLWGHLSKDQREDIISIAAERNGMYTISQTKFLEIHTFFFENIDADAYVGDVLEQWYRKASLFSGSLSTHLTSLSYWIDKGWLLPKDFFKLSAKLLFPELYLSKKFRALKQKSRHSIVDSLNDYLTQLAEIQTDDLIHTIHNSHHVPQPLPYFPASIFHYVSNMSDNCDTNIPASRIVGYIDTKSQKVKCVDIYNIISLPNYTNTMPESFIRLVESLWVDPFEQTFGVAEESVVFVPPEEPIEIVKPETETYKVLLDILLKEKGAVARKKTNEYREKCSKCNAKMKASEWITGDYTEGFGNVQKFCSRVCFDNASITIDEDESPVNEVRPEFEIHSNRIIDDLTEEFTAYYDGTIDESNSSEEWFERGISTGERLESNLIAMYGPTNQKARDVRLKINVLKNIFSGKLTVADAVLKEQEDRRQSNLKREIAKLQTYKTDEIKDWLRDQELSTEGKKSELLARAEEHVLANIGEEKVDNAEDEDDEIPDMMVAPDDDGMSLRSDSEDMEMDGYDDEGDMDFDDEVDVFG